MRAVRAAYDDSWYGGVEEADGTIRLLAEPGVEPVEVLASTGWASLDERATREVDPARCRLLAPIRRPGKILCVGLNYSDHASEQGVQPPDHPILFAKMSTAVSDPGVPIPLHPVTEETDYEVELAVVIGRRCRGIGVDRAMEIVAGYCVLNDISARDLQRADGQFVRAKSLDGFAPMGPALVSTDELGRADDLSIRCWVNGELRQDSNTRHLIFDVPALVAFCAEAMTLEPGDVISTGTPDGVGVFMDPPRFLCADDVVTAGVEGIGLLTNPVAYL